MRTFAAVAGVAGLCCGIAIAQVNSPKFDAAAIKRSSRDSETYMKAHPGGKLDISRATLRTLTALAGSFNRFRCREVPPGCAQNTSTSTQKRQKAPLKTDSS